MHNFGYYLICITVFVEIRCLARSGAILALFQMSITNWRGLTLINLERFYRPDGTDFRCRADIESAPEFWRPEVQDWVHVTVTAVAAKKFRGGAVWGMGRFAPVTKIVIL